MNRRRRVWLMMLPLLLLPALGQAQDGEPCDDDVRYRAVTFTYPGTLVAPADRGFQLPTRYRYSYIFGESFEDAGRSSALAPGTGAAWAQTEGGARDGERFLSFTGAPQGGPGDASLDPANWLVFGPFDLSKGTEGRIMAHFRLGASEDERPGSIAVLASADGKNFHGIELSGTTCDWFYRKLDLHRVPEIENLMGRDRVWIAFLPTTSPPGGERALALDNLRLLTVNPDLPPEFSMPGAPTRDMPVTYESLLEYYAPYLVQDLTGTEFGDYITRFDFDGNYIGNDNWEHLGKNCGPDSDCDSYLSGCEPEYPLPAYVYGWVTETTTHYFLGYAIFHPADDYRRNWHASHENDLEGISVMVRKDGNPYGTPLLVQLQAHLDYWQYRFPGVSGIYDDNASVDGEIGVFGGSHPVAYIQGGGHGIRSSAGEAGDGPWIHYVYTGTAMDPGFPSPYKFGTHDPDGVSPSQRVGYDLLPVTAAMWLRRADYCSDTNPCMYMVPGDYVGARAYWNLNPSFFVEDIGKELNGNTCMEFDWAASAPWNWSDQNDDYCLVNPLFAPCPLSGDWWMDSAWYHVWQFDWDVPVSTDYVFHTFIYNQLCGDLYGMLQPSLSPAFTYRVHGGSVWNPGINVPAGSEGLTLMAGADLLFDPGTSLKADGVFMTHPTMYEPYRLTNNSSQATGIVIQVGGGMKAQSGGGIRF